MFAIEIRLQDCSFNQAVPSEDLILNFALDHEHGELSCLFATHQPRKNSQLTTWQEHFTDDIKPVSSYKIGKEGVSPVCGGEGDTRYAYVWVCPWIQASNGKNTLLLELLSNTGIKNDTKGPILPASVTLHYSQASCPRIDSFDLGI